MWITVLVLALVTIAMFVVSRLWPRFSAKTRAVTWRLCVVLVVMDAVFVATKWTTASTRLDNIIHWLAVASYELLLFLFARMSPRWLTTISALILLGPVFASSVLFPLVGLFIPASGDLTSIAGSHDLYYQSIPHMLPMRGSVGADVSVFYRPPHLPFLRHKLAGTGFFDSDCNSRASYVVLASEGPKAIAHCPFWSNTSRTLEATIELPER